ncbi:hypothetical protein [Luteimonas arsenica]|uniref:hypothetical protein n=1 Tax=Luteimonas arsenica TaxID=1586242 RepID=UPI001055632F|nr:hypothetical protein [Luteimonas arsenica]
MMDARSGWRGTVLACALLAALPAGSASARAGAVVAEVAEVAEGKAAAAEPFLGGFLKETRVVYPLQVAGWEAAGEKLYDAAELGASVRYQSGERRDRWIDVYFYPVGVVPASRLDQAAKATLAEIESNVGVDGGYVEATFGPVRAFEVAPGVGKGGPIPARSADMALQREEGTYHSAMALLVDRLYYVKGRHSVAAGAMERDAVRRTLEAFMAELVAGTYIGSTGSCWSPVPVDALAAEADEPADASMSATSDQGGGAWLVGDRVLARDPSGEAAQTLSVLAMAMQGRLYPGCVGADPHNPEVPEGHREIRFEYRAPSDARRDGGWRLAPARSGTG